MLATAAAAAATNRGSVRLLSAARSATAGTRTPSSSSSRDCYYSSISSGFVSAAPSRRRPSASSSSSSSCSSSTRRPPPDDGIGIVPPPPRHHRLRALSTTSAPSAPHAVEVTVTGGCDADSKCAPPTGGGTPAPPDRAAEEEMLSLQSDLRARFRHASYVPALEVAHRLLAMTASHFGPLHPATASAHNNVGLMNKMLGRYDVAREAYHESLRVYGEVCGKDHASYAAALSNLGMLERGRAMEGEGGEEEGGDGGGDDGGGGNGDAVGRGETARMSAMERARLNESAIEYLDEAYRIRLAELGRDHPHTVSSRSQLGSAMAASVVAERRGTVRGLVEAELRKMKRSRNVSDAGEMEAYVPEAIARAASGTSFGSRLTRRRWEAAEEHLRGALDTAVENPRGEGVGPLIRLPVGGGGGGDPGSGSSGKAGEGGGGGGEGLMTTLPSRREVKEGLSKKDKKKLGKEKIRDKRRANAAAPRGGGGSDADVDDDGDGGGGGGRVQGAAAKVTTLSAATAAQNLAVFLKNYSDWTRLSLLDESSSSTTTSGDGGRRREIAELLDRTIREAQHLYESALHVRSSILPPHHPDVIATKYSLAELLDSPPAAATSTTTTTCAAAATATSLDGDRANRLREEILSAYNVEEREEDGSTSE